MVTSSSNADSTASQTLNTGLTLWLTGLSGSGKTTLSNAVRDALTQQDVTVSLLDGDVLRKGICRDLGFSAADRDENARRANLAAMKTASEGGIAIVSLISPLQKSRERARNEHRTAGLRFLEVYVDCPLDVVQARDPKGLYRQFRDGTITGLAGMDFPYEPPTDPELHVQTDRMTVGQAAQLVLSALQADSNAVVEPLTEGGR